jgi:hypothetical protein
LREHVARRRHMPRQQRLGMPPGNPSFHLSRSTVARPEGHIVKDTRPAQRGVTTASSA